MNHYFILRHNIILRLKMKNIGSWRCDKLLRGHIFLDLCPFKIENLTSIYARPRRRRRR